MISYIVEPGDSLYSCPDHPQAAVVEDYRAGDLVCTECGLVVGDRSVRIRSRRFLMAYGA